jgi:phage gpG-like protein
MRYQLKQDIKDAARFKSKMNRLKRFANVDFVKIAQDAGAYAVKKALTRVPVKTGDLKRSIRTETDGKDIYVEAGMDYAAVVEFGSEKRNRPPKPYFYNSIADATRFYEDRVDKKLNQINRL